MLLFSNQNCKGKCQYWYLVQTVEQLTMAPPKGLLRVREATCGFMEELKVSLKDLLRVFREDL